MKSMSNQPQQKLKAHQHQGGVEKGKGWDVKQTSISKTHNGQGENFL